MHILATCPRLYRGSFNQHQGKLSALPGGIWLIRTYIVHQLQVLGEAANKLSVDIRSRHPEVPWPEVLGTRHAIVHDYFRVDHEIVWGVVEIDLPPLKAQIQSMLSEFVEPPQ